MRPVATAGTTHLSFLGRLRDRSNPVGWAEFNDRYRELLYRYARRRGASDLEAEDVAQEVTMYLFKAMDRFEYNPARGRFRGYLRCAVANALSRRHARNGRQETFVEPETLEALIEGPDVADAEWEREWQLHRLRTALQAVNAEFEPLTLDAFRMHVLAGNDVDETATRLGISKASVYQAKCRVLKRLKEQVEQMDAEE
jgi:RNA polymerase sigma-70 factor (ECF subfamily)